MQTNIVGDDGLTCHLGLITSGDSMRGFLPAQTYTMGWKIEWASMLGRAKKEMRATAESFCSKAREHEDQRGGSEAEDTRLRAMRYEDATEGDSLGATTRKLRKNQEVMDYTNVRPKLSHARS